MRISDWSSDVCSSDLIIIQSGNDATVAVSEYVAGSETAFADLMNQYAARLGMNNSHFADASGLPDPNHYTTARDLTILARALISSEGHTSDLQSLMRISYPVFCLKKKYNQTHNSINFIVNT